MYYCQFHMKISANTINIKMLKTMQELLKDFDDSINLFNELVKHQEERRLSLTYFTLWRTKFEISEDETKNSNLKCLRLNLKNDFNQFCDKEIESIKNCCKNSMLELWIR